jgi:hypothetical protein
VAFPITDVDVGSAVIYGPPGWDDLGLRSQALVLRVWGDPQRAPRVDLVHVEADEQTGEPIFVTVRKVPHRSRARGKGPWWIGA